MKRVWVAIVAAALAGTVRAAEGFTDTFDLGDGTVAITNTQANSSWVAVAVMWQYAGPASGTVQVSRVSQGVSVLLGRRVFTNVTSVVWVPEGSYSYGLGDVLVVWSTATEGVLQITRRGD
ncbi:MAG: hypothetical protein PHR35_11110 [Kiritimatiellae bacterium]|nr:hypothetical protein [Kiritimatiellia bacterium]